MVRWSSDVGVVVLALEGGGAVLEELLLPGVEDGRLQVVLVTEIRDGHPVNQMASQDGDLLGGGIMLAWLSHGSSSGLDVVYNRL